MTSLWPRLEPLLAKVQKPARYIGCEDGAISPRARARARWPGCSSTPTPTRSACPTRACRSSTRSSTSAPDAVAERSYAPWIDLEALLRAAPAAAVLGRHPPAGRRLRRPRLQPVGRARLHERPELHRPGRRAGPGRRARARAPADRRRRPLHLQPRAAGRLRRLLRDRRRRGGRRRDHRGRAGVEGVGGRTPGLAASRCCGRWPPCPASTCRRCTTCAYDGADLVAVTPRYPDVPTAGRQAHRRRPGRLALPEAPARARSPRSCTTGSTSRSSGAAPGAAGSARPGMITRPVRERPAEQVRTMVRDGLRRTGYDEVSLTVAVDRRLLRHRAAWSADTVNDPTGCGSVSVSLPSLRVDAFTVGIAAQVADGPPHRPHLRPRGGHVADAPGHQQAHQRGGPLRRRRVGLLARAGAG